MYMQHSCTQKDEIKKDGLGSWFDDKYQNECEQSNLLKWSYGCCLLSVQQPVHVHYLH